MNSMKKVILPVVMSMFLVFTMMPAEAFADDAVVYVTNDGKELKVDSDPGLNVQTDPVNNEVTVKDDVPSRSGAKGVIANTSHGGEADVTVEGNVTADSTGVQAVAWDVNEKKPKTTVRVNGDVTSESSNSYGVEINANGGGEVTVQADNVTSNGAGMVVSSETGSSAKAEVLDVTGNGMDGLAVLSNGGTIDVLVDGTVTGKTGGIFVASGSDVPASNINVTVWKIEASEGDLIRFDDVSPDKQKEIKQHIHYIVKLEPSDGADLSATKADGTQLAQYHDLDTALSGEEVLLKVNLQPGYKLDGVYNGKGEKVQLIPDKDGNYLVKVTDAGGIYLSVATSKTKHNISYNLDGGSYNGQIGTITEVYDYGTAIKLLGTPTREGYRFLYWRGSQYDAGADYTVEGDHLFTAVWEKISGGSDANDSHVAKTAAKASPATGDESELALWISIMAAAVLALVYTFVRRREYNR